MSTEVRTFTCNLCDALCGLRVTVEDGKKIKEIRGNPDDVFSHGHICPKGPSLRELHDDPDRIRQPLRRTSSGWQAISWEEAFSETADRLRALRRAHGRDAVGLYIGNPTAHSHRSAFGSQAITLALRTHNAFNPNSQDSNPRLFACMQVYGDGLTVPVPDVDRIEYLLMLGANPAASNGSMMSMGDARGRLKAIRSRGGRIVLIDPRRTESAAWCDEHHFIRPGGDSAFLLALLHVLFAEELVDRIEVGRVCSGLGELAAIAARFPPERVAQAIGMPTETIRAIARELGRTPRAAAYARVGVCQSEFGPLASWLLEAVNLVTGHIDREGCAMFPAAAADVGAIARIAIGNNYGRWRSRVRGLPELFGSLPSAVMSEEMETPGAGQIRGFVCFAGNPVLSTPNGERLAGALSRLEFMVAVDYFINETTRHAHIILPPSHVFESGNFDLLMLPFAVRHLAKYSPPILDRRPDSRDDWEILSELAMRIGLPRIPWLRRFLLRRTAHLPERIVDWLLRAGRWGDHFVPWRKGLRLAELGRTTQGIDLGPLEPSGRGFPTPDGKARLAPAPFLTDLPRLEKWIDSHTAVEVRSGVAPFSLIGRRHLRSNNSWMHNERSLVKGPDRAQLHMNRGDAEARGFREGALVRIHSRTGELTVPVVLSDDLMAGVVSLPHGYGHQVAADTLHVAGPLPGGNSNALTDELLVEPIIGNSILNGVQVWIDSAQLKGDISEETRPAPVIEDGSR